MYLDHVESTDGIKSRCWLVHKQDGWVCKLSARDDQCVPSSTPIVTRFLTSTGRDHTSVNSTSEWSNNERLDIRTSDNGIQKLG